MIDSATLQTLAIPVVVALLSLFVVVLYRLDRRDAEREKRREAGLCANCGYDLRASRGRCPECGKRFAHKPLPGPPPSADLDFRISQHDFADDAITAIDLARQHARRLGHDYLGTEHILLGILDTADEHAIRILRESNLTPEQVRQAVESCIEEGPFGEDVYFGYLPATPSARHAVESAHHLMQSDNSPKLHTDHLLRAILQDSTATATNILQTLTPPPSH